jgi:hypothetical protein
MSFLKEYRLECDHVGCRTRIRIEARDDANLADVLNERDWQGIPVNIRYATGMAILGRPTEPYYRTATVGFNHYCPIHRREHIESIDFVQETTYAR